MITLICAITDPWAIAAIAIGVFVALNLIFLALAVFMVFKNTIYRSPKKPRTRECTNKKDDDQMRMFSEGVAWAGKHQDITEQLHITNDGLNLYGEYINFGFDKCAVILQGRTESLLYSYYFADVYAKNGYNILVIDVRMHGLSDGNYGTLGIKESDDLIEWLKFVSAKYNMTNFVVHGICIGGATAILAYAKLKKQGSNLIKGIVTDGAFQSGYEIYKWNMKKYKQPAFPVLHLVFALSYVLTGARFFRDTPLRYIKDVDIPILMIWSEKDAFCVKDKSQQLFDACLSKYKELKFFPEGRHSHVRSLWEKEYDDTISEFLKKYQEE